MKRIVALFLAFVIISAFSVPVTYAAQAGFSNQYSDEELAYLDLASVSSSMKTAVLAARSRIIASTSWVADDVTGYIYDADGNIIDILSHFSEIFPADWEIPSVSSSEYNSVNIRFSQRATMSDINYYYSGSVYLQNPPSNSDSPAFCTVNAYSYYADGTPFHVTQLFTQGYHNYPSDYTAKYNVGYKNAITNAELGHATNLANGQSFSIIPPTSVSQIAVRASTYNTVGNWDMNVTGIIDLI